MIKNKLGETFNKVTKRYKGVAYTIMFSRQEDATKVNIRIDKPIYLAFAVNGDIANQDFETAIDKLTESVIDLKKEGDK